MLLFFAAMLVTESRYEGTLFSDALFLIGLFLIGLATTGRLWCALFISGHKRASLTTEGPYSVTRNPLYFFSFLGFIGTGLATEAISFALAFMVFFYPLYLFTIDQEERYLGAKFGTAFADYCARTPRFFPNPRLYREPETYLVSPRQFRRTMLDAVWFIWLIGVIELVEALHEHDILRPLIRLP
ncbi:MAG: methyltransferase family protein [Gammaproteobacteria bacterium]